MSHPGWYYARNGQSVGPVTSAQLRQLAESGTLTPADMILQAGTEKWVAASKVKGLFPTALPSSEPTAPPAPCGSAPAAPRSGSSSKLLGELLSKHQVLAEGQVVPDSPRCVQCGCCSYNCPMGIDVRGHAHRGVPIHDSHCLTCGECVKRCPRGVLRFERISLLSRG
jgi:NAD-dependent dihydropyrimidine dehydrogenase PreA subunit